MTYTVTPTSADGCEGDDFTITITVNPEPSINNVTEAICSENTFNISPSDGTDGDVVPTGTTYTWGNPVSTPVEAISGGFANSDQSNISQLLTNDTNTPAFLTYTVTPTSADGCIGDNFEIIIEENPLAVPTSTNKKFFNSTKFFLELCDKNNGKLYSVDIKDYSQLFKNDNWKFIH